MFKELSNLIPSNGSLKIVLHKNLDVEGNESLTAYVMPELSEQQKSVGAKPITPCVLSGSVEDMNSHFAEELQKFAPAVRGFVSTVEEVTTILEARKAEAMKKTEKKSKATSGKTTSAKEDRKTAEKSEDHVKALKTVTVTDENFKSALKSASLASLTEVLNDSEVSVNKRKLVARQIGTIEDKTVPDVLIPVLATEAKKVINGNRENLLESIKKLGGDLGELGLTPTQPSLI